MVVAHIEGTRAGLDGATGEKLWDGPPSSGALLECGVLIAKRRANHEHFRFGLGPWQDVLQPGWT